MLKSVATLRDVGMPWFMNRALGRAEDIAAGKAIGLSFSLEQQQGAALGMAAALGGRVYGSIGGLAEVIVRRPSAATVSKVGSTCLPALLSVPSACMSACLPAYP